jgi:hypothetical protein
MRCACPWCPNEVEPGCEAPVSGEPTCKEHDWRADLEEVWLCRACHNYHQGEYADPYGEDGAGLDLHRLDRTVTGMSLLLERGISKTPNAREKSGDRICACCQRTPVGMFYRYTLSNPEFRASKEER